METKDALVNEESFDPDEALSAAVDKRKFLLKQLLEDQGRFSDSDYDDQWIDVMLMRNKKKLSNFIVSYFIF